jgi:hypothetical protein
VVGLTVSVLPLVLLLVIADRGGDLSTQRLRHHEVLRIDRDFGMPKWELALDGWAPHDDPGAVESLKLWWVNVEDDDRRKPFASYLRRVLEFGFEPIARGGLAVRLAGDRKEYAFTVEPDAAGIPAVHATIDLDDGSRIERCRCQRGRLLARRVLGVPIGIANLRVRCTDTAGVARDGAVVFREVAKGPAYTPEPASDTRSD